MIVEIKENIFERWSFKTWRKHFPKKNC